MMNDPAEDLTYNTNHNNTSKTDININILINNSQFINTMESYTLNLTSN